MTPSKSSSKPIKIFAVMGARPNFMKIAPLVRRWKGVPELAQKFSFSLVHTGQHYDDDMSGVFLRRLGIDDVAFCMNIGSGSHAEQTAKIMTSFEKICLTEKPDWVFVVGDVNSTLACSITAKKCGVQVCHVEAGLRSFNRSMPEEINRIVTDSISDLFFTTSPEAEGYLSKEGIPHEKIHFVGNLMIDSLLYEMELLKQEKKTSSAQEKICLVTLHRPSNVDEQEVLQEICQQLRNVSEKVPVVFPVHPRTRANLRKFNLEKLLESSRIRLEDPADFSRMCALYQKSLFVVTDSGGVQEETTALGIPCLTLRRETERPVTVTVGTNTIIGHDWNILHGKIEEILTDRYKSGRIPDLWDGRAAHRIWAVLQTMC